MTFAAFHLAAVRHAGLCGALAAAMLCAGCAREPKRATPDDLAHIRSACPRGSFAAAMASNCPEIVR